MGIYWSIVIYVWKMVHQAKPTGSLSSTIRGSTRLPFAFSALPLCRIASISIKSGITMPLLSRACGDWSRLPCSSTAGGTASTRVSISRSCRSTATRALAAVLRQRDRVRSDMSSRSRHASTGSALEYSVESEAFDKPTAALFEMLPQLKLGSGRAGDEFGVEMESAACLEDPWLLTQVEGTICTKMHYFV